MDDLQQQDKKQSLEPEHVLAPARIQFEKNLTRLPIFPLQKGRSKTFATKDGLLIHLERTEMVDDDLVNSLWEVRGPLQPADKGVFLGVQAFITQNFTRQNLEVPEFVYIRSYRALLLLMDRPHGKWQIDKLVQSLRNITGTTCRSKNSWLFGKVSTEKNRPWYSGDFHLYDEVWFHGDTLPSGQQLVRGILVKLGRLYRENLNARHTVPIDYELCRELSNPAAVRLVEFISPKFYGLLKGGGRQLTQDYVDFCQRMPFEIRPTQSQAMQSLARLFAEATAKQFLGKPPEFQWSSYAKKILLTPGKRFHTFINPTSSASAERSTTSPADKKTLVAMLRDRGVAPEEIAERLVDRRPYVVRTQIAYFDHEVTSGKRIGEPGAYLNYRITNNAPAPKGYVSAHEQAKKQRERAAISQRLRDQESTERDRRVNWWKYISLEEKARAYVAGPWTARFLTENNFREPNAEERSAAHEECLELFRKELPTSSS